MSLVGDTITALRTQLQAASGLSYASDSGYEDADVVEMVQSNKFPFFNITCEGWTTSPTDKMRLENFERITMDILIQFATRALKLTIAKQGDSSHIGIYEFADDIWTAIKADKTLGSVVHGYRPGSEVSITVVEAGDATNRYYIGAAEMRVKFYKDQGILP